MSSVGQEKASRRAAILTAIAAGLTVIGTVLVWTAPWANLLLLAAAVCGALGIRGSRGIIRITAIASLVVAGLVLLVSAVAGALFLGLVDG